MAKLTRRILRACESYQRNKLLTQASQAILELVLPKKSIEILSIDFLGPLTKTKYGYEQILVMVDMFTKYTKLYPMRKATGEMAVRKIDEFIKYIGMPQKVLSDKGTQFTSHRWREALEERGIQKILTSIRHPQANMVERYLEAGKDCEIEYDQHGYEIIIGTAIEIAKGYPHVWRKPHMSQSVVTAPKLPKNVRKRYEGSDEVIPGMEHIRPLMTDEERIQLARQEAKEATAEKKRKKRKSKGPETTVERATTGGRRPRRDLPK
ncbi:uncharacterized protein LOC117176673 [Belonocnema kinseyi]|uniref:uncharacterized protein LOC117176673 n=1 Tax=Belonocnema kinseyi TaxID=2817044 RepID=UPI00143D0849|nr:uncharacterized protein LOC117176673 [Belonocnema kinseyi]